MRNYAVVNYASTIKFARTSAFEYRQAVVLAVAQTSRLVKREMRSRGNPPLNVEGELGRGMEYTSVGESFW